jgi:cephalosporin hydroxylase
MNITDEETPEYHIWFFERNVWLGLTWCGVPTLKSPMDVWNYQEIITELKPSLIVEFGTFKGGSALFFAGLLQQLGHKSKVFTCDPFDWGISPLAKNHPLIEMMQSASTTVEVYKRIEELRKEYPGPVFAILDGDHYAGTVLKELLMLRGLLVKGDYVITEDSNISGHPIMTDSYGQRDPSKFCPGPYEAVVEYERMYPDDYTHDTAREKKFGWTFAPNGFLIKR